MKQTKKEYFFVYWRWYLPFLLGVAAYILFWVVDRYVTDQFYLGFEGMIWVAFVISLMYIMKLKFVKTLGFLLISGICGWYALVYDLGAGLLCVDVCPPNKEQYLNTDLFFHYFYEVISLVSLGIFVVIVLRAFLRYMNK